MPLYRLTMEVTVHDVAALAAKARAVASDGGVHALTVKEWEELRSEGDPVSADLQMIFDPGVSPDGTSIEEVTVECLGLD